MWTQRKEQQLNEQFQNVHLVFENDPSEKILVALNFPKERNEKCAKKTCEIQSTLA